MVEVCGTLTARGPTSSGAAEVDGSHIIPWPAQVAPTLNAAFGSKQGLEDQHIRGGAGLFVPAIAFDTTQITSPGNFSNPKPSDPCHPLAAGAHPPAIISFSSNMSNPDCQADGTTPTLKLGGHGGGNPPAVAYPINTQLALRGADTSNTSREGIGLGDDGDPAFTLQAAHSHAVAFGETARTLSARHDGSPCADRGPDVIAVQSAVRRLTPRECERLQGFPDDWTLIPYRNKPADQCPDGPRYKALGNSMAVPVMAWIGQRIAAVDAITTMERAA